VFLVNIHHSVSVVSDPSHPFLGLDIYAKSNASRAVS
jgi:hypothetical protein